MSTVTKPDTRRLDFGDLMHRYGTFVILIVLLVVASILSDVFLTQRNLMNVLRRVDHSFVKERQNFRASNRDGYLVDLVEPLRHPPRQRQAATIGTDRDDLDAVEIEGLVWLENAPSFEAVVIDDRGAPARMVVPDPRVFAAHKLWLSKRPDRDPLQRRRDAAQAQAVASLVALHLPHLPYVASELKLLPLETYNDARSLFAV